MRAARIIKTVTTAGILIHDDVSRDELDLNTGMCISLWAAAVKRAVLLFLFLPVLALAGNQSVPIAKEGILNAASWNPEQGSLSLQGQWSFSWKRLLPASHWQPPQAPWFRMPSTWDVSGSAGWQYPGLGYASFLLEVNQLTETHEYALLIPEVSTAYRLFVNGQMVSEGGQVAASEADSEAYTGNKIAAIGKPDQGRFRLQLQVANHHHNSGGPWQAIELGEREAITQKYYDAKVYDALIAALMVIMAGLLVLEYLVDPKDKTGLWLGLLALALGIRIGMTDNNTFYWLLGFELPWSWNIRFAYTSMLISPVFFLAWLHNSFPLDLSRRASLILSLPYVASTALCLLLPPLYFTQLLSVFSVLVVSIVVVGSLLLIQVSWREREGATLSLLGLLALGGAASHDVMVNNQLLHGNPWISTGLLLFVLTQTSNFLRLRVLQRRKIEYLSRQLADANHQLERRVELRTRDLAEKAQALEQANNQLQVLANVDSLTGLLNRRAFIEQMQQLSELPVPVALLWIDIDHFKQINDTYGHIAGDEVLKGFGHLLQQLGRDQDRIGRLGGEEFALLLLDCDQQGAAVFARRLQQALSRLRFEEWPALHNVTASIGIAIGRLGEDSWEQLITQADEAMYEVKRNGRNGYAFI